MLDKKAVVSFIICKISKLVLLIERPLFKLNDKLCDFYYKINTPEADPKAEKWAKQNPWFGEDPMLTNFAFKIHRNLTEKEGVSATSDKYYNEIDKRLYRRCKKRYLKYYSHNN